MRDLTNRQREILYNWGSASLSDTKEPGSNYEQFFYHFRIDMEMQLALEKIRKAVRRQRRAARREKQK